MKRPFFFFFSFFPIAALRNSHSERPLQWGLSPPLPNKICVLQRRVLHRKKKKQTAPICGAGGPGTHTGLGIAFSAAWERKTWWPWWLLLLHGGWHVSRSCCEHPRPPARCMNHKETPPQGTNWSLFERADGQYTSRGRTVAVQAEREAVAVVHGVATQTQVRLGMLCCLTRRE